ncbi:putative HAMP domain-containing protein [uncultured Gammaproteobacteria bacterium]
MNSIALRIGATIVAIFVCAIALMMLLSFHKFTVLLTEVVHDRLEFAIENIQNSVEAGLNLGVPLATLGRTQEILEQQLKQEKAILSIEAFDHAGVVIFATDRSLIGDLVAEEWLEAPQRVRRRVWVISDPDALVVGAALANSVGQTAGGVAIRYAHEALTRSASRARVELAQLGLTLVGATALMAFIGVWLLLRSTRGSLAQMEQTARAALHDDGAMAFTPQGTLPIEIAFAHFLTSSAAAMTAIHETSGNIRRLDEDE